MSGLLHGLLDLPAIVAYAVIALLVFGEAALFFGFVLPGETAVVLGGVLASRGRASLATLCLIVVAAAIIGDSVGYQVGRRLGPRLLRVRPMRRHQIRLERAQQFLRRRGGTGVFLGRFTAFLRAVMPGLAGVSRVPYPRFFFFNALGGVVWGVGFTVLGFLAGDSYARVEGYAGRGGAALLLIVVLVLVFAAYRRRRARQAADT